MFGFQVERADPDWGREGWIVSLPHQCDAWDIAGDGLDGVPHAEAVADLEAFIVEAQATLAELKERE